MQFPREAVAVRPARNIELKARLPDLDAARQVALRLATRTLGTLHQVDTYFHTPRGRLKLREIDGLAAELIWYDRPDAATPRQSDYLLVPVANPHTLNQALSAAWGVKAIVEKRREVFLVDNVRIHLDEVQGLGTFLEFEAVLGQDEDDAAGRAQVDRLIQEFGIAPKDVLSGSYGELAQRPDGATGEQKLGQP